ncbi:MAG: hypothetical protein ACMG6S_33295, partial [Byssovorax sp.]
MPPSGVGVIGADGKTNGFAPGIAGGSFEGTFRAGGRVDTGGRWMAGRAGAAADLVGAVIVGPLGLGASGPAAPPAGFSAAIVFSATGFASSADAAAGDVGTAPRSAGYSRVGRASCGCVASSSASSPVEGDHSPSISRVVIFRCGAARGFSVVGGSPGALGISSASKRAGV